MSRAPLPPDAPPKRALLAIFLIVFTDLLGFGIIIPLLAFYVPDFRDHPLKVTGLFSIFSICQFIAAPILGALSDRFGRRPVLILSQIGSALGYLLLAYASSMDQSNKTLVLGLVYLSRIIDGLSGGNISTAQAYISDVTTPANRAKGMGLLGAAFGIGFTAGPAIGGILYSINHPYLPSCAAALCSAAAALCSYRYLPESHTRRPVDVEAWLHPSVFTPVLRKPILLQLLLIAFLAMAAFVMMESTIALYLNAHMRINGVPFSQRHVGYYFAFAGLIIAIVQGGLIGRLTKRFGEWPLAIAGPLLVALGMLGYTAIPWRPSLALLLLAGAINASGRSFHQPTLSSLLSKNSDPREQGVVFGLYHGLLSIARVFGPLLAGVSFPHLRNTAPYLLAAAIVTGAAAWTAAVRARHPSATPELPGFEVVPPAEA